MRTTLTLDADVRALLERRMRDRGVSFKVAVNDALRAGLTPDSAGEPRTYTVSRDFGTPRLDLTKALRVAGELEDEELARRLAAGR